MRGERVIVSLLRRLGAIARHWVAAWVSVWLLLASLPGWAGQLDAAALQARLPAPLVLGERDAQLPVWPVFRPETTSRSLAGYVFESVDFAALPGFSGTPVDLLIVLDPQGRLVDVQVVSQHEPVFVDGLGPAPLLHFVEQYKGLSLRQSVRIGGPGPRGVQATSANVTFDGVAKATASVRIVNQSVLSAALQVARAKMGWAGGADPASLARVREDSWRPMDAAALQRAGLLSVLTVGAAEGEKAFAGSGVEQPVPPGAPPLAEVAVAWLSAPLVGRNLLSEAGWEHLKGRLDPGDQALLVVPLSGYSFVGEDFTRGAVPDRLNLHQGELSIELRDLDLDEPLKLPPGWNGRDAKVMRVIGAAGLDPGQPLDFGLRVVRTKGSGFVEKIARDFTLRYTLPEDQLIRPEPPQAPWVAAWKSRWVDLAVLAVALALLGGALLRPSVWVSRPHWLPRARVGFLLFTLGFIGWWAQGQLSIVNLTALIQALREGRGLGFFLLDPMTVALWAVVAVSLVLWGRGTFCGWLCPFGAFQELVSQLGQRLGIKPRRLRQVWDRRLKRLKYVVLAGIVGVAAVAPVHGAWVDRVVEFEPFKTAITLGFQRAWPAVVWAVGLLALSLFLYKGFCRYLCPLGAGLALLGRLRRWDWIARRMECGTPCQTCRHRCHYQAIAPEGTVDYAECFQCLDCVAIHDDPARCAPLIAQARQRVIPIRAVPAQRPGRAPA
ncbi:4Fe-4S binding protein [Ideonella dechloratans]|uniref:4Fe-4S binding protein n=1 Tax=Ideonella dechloratans TaxID=36863 RepID=A0A643FEK4_IDEDE|nr:4Fe-4S binding protein [Ideonella dechloratans]